MRLLAIGDIHGYLGKLQKLMDQVDPQPETRWYFWRIMWIAARTPGA